MEIVNVNYENGRVGRSAFMIAISTETNECVATSTIKYVPEGYALCEFEGSCGAYESILVTNGGKPTKMLKLKRA
jgi:hypothetical protein